MIGLLRSWFGRLKRHLRETEDRRLLAQYLASDRRPWSPGFQLFRNRELRGVLSDPTTMNVFRDDRPLPEGHGFRLDARLVELPWAMSRLSPVGGRVLDAGSSLNYDFILKSLADDNKQVTVFTLAPEGSHCDLGASYCYGDLRDMYFRDASFDCVACISTIEHIGMDNSFYAGASSTAKRSTSDDFLIAVDEFRRVLRPGGKLLISFPFGKDEDHGWFRQFDAARADRLIARFAPSAIREAVFAYKPQGWVRSDRGSCRDCEFFDVRASKHFDSKSTLDFPPDFPAGERAVMCLEMTK